MSPFIQNANIAAMKEILLMISGFSTTYKMVSRTVKMEGGTHINPQNDAKVLSRFKEDIYPFR